MTILCVFGVTAIALAAATGTANAQEKVGPIANGTIKGEVAARIDERLSGLAEKDFSGVVLVAHGGTIVLAKGYGFLRQGGAVSITPGGCTETYLKLCSSRTFEPPPPMAFSFPGLISTFHP